MSRLAWGKLLGYTEKILNIQNSSLNTLRFTFLQKRKKKKNLLLRVDGFTVTEEFKNILAMR